MGDMSISRERKRKKAYSEEEKQHYVQLYQQSKLSKQAFCQQQGIAVSTLYRWLTETPSVSSALAEAPIEPAMQWQAIKTPPSVVSAVLQLQFSNTLRLMLPTSTDPHWLSQLLRELAI